MFSIPKDPKKRQKYLILILAVIIIIGIFVIWYNYFAIPGPPPPETKKIQTKEIKINIDLLKSQFLKKLEAFDTISSFEGEKGRENPFISYE